MTVMRFTPKPPRVKSPCVDVCVMDEDSGYCLGCKRSLDEIAGWATASDPERTHILSLLPTREVREYEDSVSWRDEQV